MYILQNQGRMVLGGGACARLCEINDRIDLMKAFVKQNQCWYYVCVRVSVSVFRRKNPIQIPENNASLCGQTPHTENTGRAARVAVVGGVWWWLWLFARVYAVHYSIHTLSTRSLEPKYG